MRPSVIAIAITLGMLGPSEPAHARPASASDFIITYYTTDGDGNRARKMGERDLQQFINRARCECEQRIEVTISLRPSGEAFDPTRIRTYAGTGCDQGANNPQGTGQFKPCVLLQDQLPNFYTKTPSMQFEPIWLSTGIAQGSGQSINVAIPAGDCTSGQGQGGIWICVENGAQSNCQADEFIISGTQNNNVGMMAMMQGIQFDYDPPLSVPTEFDIAEGDGAVLVSWDFQVTGDVSGYRVLCADANGNPIPGKGISRPSVTAINQGTLYFTQENLCGGSPFEPGDDIDDVPIGTSGTGGDTGDFTSDGTIGDFTGGLTDMTDGGTLATATDGGTDPTMGDGTGRGTGTSGGTGGIVLPGDGIESLDWSYVCTGHLPFNSKSARIDGLDNGVEYQFLVVAYDAAGNPVPASQVFTASPRETRDLWEQCEAQGKICGDGGYCTCRADDPHRSVGLLWMLLGIGVGYRRRRRR